ncbi:PilZ domain-containing protein [Arenimonas sp. GDDSR-1]|uniref:PilZ domain-containing protein n=1 Tax=Arenimonas sp. GDDSR-1 TaxID=2950125 RepID=UPI002601EC38|nr:PilZ domain-containing protein [Arenimonas sp. GDDSR-1]
MTEESRRLQRRKADTPITVIDAMTGQRLGMVIDLSESGMMLSSEQSVAADALFQCELQFSHGAAQPVKVGLHELWSTSDEASGAVLIGFRFIDISKDDRIRLRAWVAEPGSHYV